MLRSLCYLFVPENLGHEAAARRYLGLLLLKMMLMELLLLNSPRTLYRVSGRHVGTTASAYRGNSFSTMRA